MLKVGKGSLQFIHYTTSAINNVNSNFLVVDYLVNSLGFSKQVAILTSSKVSSLKSPVNPNLVVNFLKTNGFDAPQIRKIVSSFPKILSCKVEKTLKPKLEVFHEFGMHGSELSDIISLHPWVFSCGLDKIVKAHRVLTTIFGDDLFWLQALNKSTWMLNSCAPKNAPLNVALLKSYGFSVDQIKKIFLTKCRYFSIDPRTLHCILIRVEEKIGIPRDSAMFLYGVCSIGGMSEELLESKFRVFRGYGWSELDILTLARRFPCSFALSELKIRTGLNFFMKELKHETVEIVRHSYVLTFNLEKRVIPRIEVFKVLKERGLIKANYKILSLLHWTEPQFLNKFVLPFKDDVLHVYTDYMTRAGASVKTVP